MSVADEWGGLIERSPSRAWSIINQRAPDQIFPKSDVFGRCFALLEQLMQRDEAFKDHLFLGQGLEDGKPLLVQREVFDRHAYILGQTGSGKTSSILASLVLQLGWRWGSESENQPAVIIIDPKPVGPDPTLTECAHVLSRVRGMGQPWFVSSSPRFKSRLFEPIEAIELMHDPSEIADYLMNAFGLVYEAGYGKDFFTAAQEFALRSRAKKGFASYDELVRAVARVVRDGEKDARGLVAAMSRLCDSKKVHTGWEDLPLERSARIRDVIADGGVLHYHLDTQNQKLLSRDLGRLAIYGALEAANRAASEAEARGERRRHVYIFADEFHNFGVQNIMERVNDIRSSGVSLVMCHQSPRDLTGLGGDMFKRLYSMAGFRASMSLDDELLQEAINAGSPERIRRLNSYGNTKGNSRGTRTSEGEQSGSSTSLRDQGSSSGRSSGRGTSEEQTESVQKGWREEYTPYIDGETVMKVKGGDLVAIVDIVDNGNGVTPTSGEPTLIQCFRPFERTGGEGPRWSYEVAEQEGPSIVQKARKKKRLQEERKKRPVAAKAGGNKVDAPTTDSDGGGVEHQGSTSAPDSFVLTTKVSSTSEVIESLAEQLKGQMLKRSPRADAPGDL